MVIYILNAAIIPSYGKYIFRRMEIEEARELVKQGFVSAIGHEGTARVLSEMLGTEIPVNRIRVSMEPRDKAIVFRLLQRLPEGKVLSREELEKVPFELGLLERIE